MIEVGESLGLSWLKHIRGCSVVQNNWKASPRMPWRNLTEIDVILRELRQEFGEDSIDIFGEVNASQLVRQTECDVLGFSLNEGECEAIALEVAMHLTGAGLCYSGERHDRPGARVNVSDDKVPAKLFSNAMALYAAMGIQSGELAFATPIANDDLAQRISDRLNRIERILRGHGLEFSMRLYANTVFYDEILRPVVAVASDISNANEFFLRAMQVYMASFRRWGVSESEGDDGFVMEDVDPVVMRTRGRRLRYDVMVNGTPYRTQLSMGDAAYYSVVAYCENTPNVVYSELRATFPRAAHGSREVVEVENAELDLRRFSGPIILNDRTRVLVSNQWCGAGPHENWQRFVDHVETLGREGLEIRIVPHQ